MTTTTLHPTATPRGHALFSTAIGVCGIAWNAVAVEAVQLPEATEPATRERLLKGLAAGSVADEPPPHAAQAIAGIQALLAGEPRDLLEIALDTSRLTPFQSLVFDVVRRIPPGQTLTYGEVAQAVGRPHGARAVGQAMGFNPFAPVVPCHRVLAAGNRPGGFSATGGAATKLHMLAIEGALSGDTPTLF